jgi:threonine/homoserine/homoserine lactone efflux protein
LYSVFIAAAILGISAGFSPGPTLTLVVSESLQHGKMAGFKVAIAPLITDIPIIISVSILADSLLASRFLLGLVAFAGGVYVMYLGVESLRFKGIDSSGTLHEGSSLRKAVITNALNPHPYLFWGTVGISTLHKASMIGTAVAVAFVFAFYAFLIGSKMLIAAVVSLSRAWLHGRAYILIIRAIGVFLAAFALILILEGWRLISPP